MKWYQSVLFTYLITRSIIENSFSRGIEKKKQKPLGSSIVRTVKVLKAGGQACNISPINDENLKKINI